jgi:Tol biopolymer transport system component
MKRRESSASSLRDGNGSEQGYLGSYSSELTASWHTLRDLGDVYIGGGSFTAPTEKGEQAMVRTIGRSYFTVISVLVAMTLICVLASNSGAADRDTTRVSVDSSGAEANDYSGGGWGYSDADISDDGRYVAFSSYATNLVDGDTNDFGTDIFVHDRTTGTTERVSVNSSGAEANGESYSPSISSDGRYVAFISNATNLVPENDTNNAHDVFVHDRTTRTTERVSVSASEAEANGDSFSSTISADGRYVAFDSDASNLVANDGNGATDAFVYDLTTKTTERVSVGPMVEGSATQGNGASYSPSISADGRYVAFDSDASNLVANDSNTFRDIFVYDRTAGTTQWVSQSRLCICTTAHDNYTPSISADGRFVAFTGTTNNGSEIFVSDRNAPSNSEWVSRPVSGTFQNEYGDNLRPSISANGRFVAFTSSQSNLVPQGESYPYHYDVFVRDRSTKTTELVTTSSCTTKANGDSFSSTISADGRYAVFYSEASNLVADDTNGFGDVFVHDRQLKDCIAPTTSANATIPNSTGSSPYTSGTPTNQNVTVSLNAQDNQNGSDIKEIRYSATGADAISEQTVTAANLPATFTIDAAGVTTISYFATDNAGNQESPAKTLIVNIDRNAPRVSTATPTGTNVARGTNATAFFSEKMDSSSIDTSTFMLFRCSSTTSTNCATQISDVSVTPSTDRLSATLNPFPTSSSTVLASKTKYKVLVTTGAKDVAGNQLDQDSSVFGNQQKVWYFTTGRK